MKLINKRYGIGVEVPSYILSETDPLDTYSVLLSMLEDDFTEQTVRKELEDVGPEKWLRRSFSHFGNFTQTLYVHILNVVSRTDEPKNDQENRSHHYTYNLLESIGAVGLDWEYLAGRLEHEQNLLIGLDGALDEHPELNKELRPRLRRIVERMHIMALPVYVEMKRRGFTKQKLHI